MAIVIPFSRGEKQVFSPPFSRGEKSGSVGWGGMLGGVCGSLFFIGSGSGKKMPAVAGPAIFSFVLGSCVLLAVVTLGQLDFCKHYIILMQSPSSLHCC